MTFFPGPWKHKAWFIPLGLVVIHLVNIFRISGLSILLIYFPEHWQFTHDYIWRPFFYVVMFLLWVWWVEKFRDRKPEEGNSTAAESLSWNDLSAPALSFRRTQWGEIPWKRTLLFSFSRGHRPLIFGRFLSSQHTMHSRIVRNDSIVFVVISREAQRREISSERALLLSNLFLKPDTVYQEFPARRRHILRPTYKDNPNYEDKIKNDARKPTNW